MFWICIIFRQCNHNLINTKTKLFRHIYLIKLECKCFNFKLSELNSFLQLPSVKSIWRFFGFFPISIAFGIFSWGNDCLKYGRILQFVSATTQQKQPLIFQYPIAPSPYLSFLKYKKKITKKKENNLTWLSFGDEIRYLCHMPLKTNVTAIKTSILLKTQQQKS